MRFTQRTTAAAASVLLLLIGTIGGTLAGCGGGGGSDESHNQGGIRVESPVPIPGGHVPDDFRPKVLTVTPTTGPRTGGTDVVITGENFLAGDAPDNPDGVRDVVFGNRHATNIQYISETEIHCTSPEVNWTGAGEIYVANKYGDNTWSKDAVKAVFTYTDAENP